MQEQRWDGEGRTEFEIRGHQHAMSAGIGSVVRELVELLGATLVAAIGGVSETRAVKQWMADREPQRPQVLRFTLQLCWMIGEKGSGDMVRAWFQGSNPHLNDAAPLFLLRDRPLSEVQGPLIAAARAFSLRSA